MKTVNGKCMCGAVTVSFETDREHFDVCHCGMCRKWGGGPAFTVDGGNEVKFKGEEFISKYRSSEWAERSFCKQCGTHLYYMLVDTGFKNVPMGLIEGAEKFHFELQIFIDFKPESYSFANKTKTMTEAEIFAKYVK